MLKKSAMKFPVATQPRLKSMTDGKLCHFFDHPIGLYAYNFIRLDIFLIPTHIAKFSNDD